ncbi:hypothetical protein P3T24_006499 [Paraburkholderia sp. GAS33]|uniref:hypothetical protein n=1 Tax=Paraburkholderia sp. GAS33 TaxID=3035130 RepID=UPI003D1EBAFE
MVDDEATVIEGAVGGTAWRESLRVTVYDEDGETLFSLPTNWTADQINIALRIYRKALGLGVEIGERSMQSKVRSLLGITQ